MKSSLPVLIPPVVAKSLVKFGQDLAMARRKRHLTIKMMAERTGVAPNTYSRIERGDPRASLGIYAMALYVLGFGGALGDVADTRRDEVGLLQDEARLPQRVRVRRNPTSR
jgi:transcriptional regulator with XRE-family HTH domain